MSDSQLKKEIERLRVEQGQYEEELESLRLKVEAYKRYRTENRRLQAKVDELLEYEGMAYDD